MTSPGNDVLTMEAASRLGGGVVDSADIDETIDGIDVILARIVDSAFEVLSWQSEWSNMLVDISSADIKQGTLRPRYPQLSTRFYRLSLFKRNHSKTRDQMTFKVASRRAPLLILRER